ncbi:MAG: twin-arginine translocation signal domain-containing protein [Bacteroidota bacterium]
MEPNKSRRDFIRQSGIIAGGLAILPNMAGANFYSGANDTIKIALVGCGGRGTGAATQGAAL